MEVKLIKMLEGYIVSLTGDIDDIYAITNKELAEGHRFYSLSLKNCQAVENGYDLDEFVQEYLTLFPSEYSDTDRKLVRMGIKSGFKEGFQKALEIRSDKKFSESDMIKFGEYCRSELDGLMKTKGLFNEFEQIKSLQQTEFDVEIVTHAKENGSYTKENGFEQEPKLDADGCLILKNK